MQDSEKLNIWGAIFYERIAGPFLTGNLTRVMYLDLLENNIDPALTNIIENNENYPEDQLIFQEGGATTHYVLLVQQYRDRSFANKWIGRRGVEWPPQLPDMSPSDFFL